MGKIILQQADVSYRLTNKRKVYEWIEKVIRSFKKAPGEIGIILCSDEYLLDLNNRFLSHDYYTDIITFDYSEFPLISGELYISLDRVIDNAIKENTHTRNELDRVIIHGVLHLCGFKDKTKDQKNEMRLQEDKMLKKRTW